MGVVVAGSLILGSAACNAATPTPKPIIAVLSRVDNRVFVSAAGQPAARPASAGMGLAAGATVTTAAQSGAVISLGANNNAYLESSMSVTLLRIAAAGQGTEADLQLNAGRLLALMPAGHLNLATALGQADLIGGGALFDYRPGALGLADSVFTITCLAITCTVNTRVFGGDLGPGDQVRISNSGLNVDRARLSEADVAALLAGLQYGAPVATALAARPTAAATEFVVIPTQPVVSFTAAIPTRTLQPTRSTATPAALASDTATATLTPTPTLTPGRGPTGTATRRTPPSATLRRPTLTPAQAAQQNSGQ